MSRSSRLSSEPGQALLRATDGGWLRFESPVGALTVRTSADLPAALAEAQRQLAAGRHVVGVLAYEAASAFDPALTVLPDDGFPVAWFGFFDAARPVGAPRAEPVPVPVSWQAEVTDAAYRAGVQRVREALAGGVCYQVNYTQRLRATAPAPWPWFAAAAAAAPYAAYVDIGSHVIASASPELLFARRGSLIECRPMKGTMRRGRSLAEDRRLARALRHSVKERAENLMITDMVRNDLGRIARPGSVTVPRLFELQRFADVWQMISRVQAHSDADLTALFGALFPAASVTGAPKVQAMREIAALERSPRRVYCGSVGYAAPDGSAQFNVAIRTLLWRRADGAAEYGTGSGIVWDSRPAAEARECRLKARQLRRPPAPFGLIETLRWSPAEGYFLLDEHLRRLYDSARWAGIGLAPDAARQALVRAAAGFAPAVQRVRLVAQADGRVEVTAAPLAWPGPRLWTLALADHPVDSRDGLLYHKTTRRAVYDRARAGRPDADDVLLWNRRGELTESTVANLAFLRDGVWYTPPVRCGLLPGTYRAVLLAGGRLREGVLTCGELAQVQALAVFNSLRGWLAARLIDREVR